MSFLEPVKISSMDLELKKTNAHYLKGTQTYCKNCNESLPKSFRGSSKPLCSYCKLLLDKEVSNREKKSKQEEFERIRLRKKSGF